MRYDDYDDYSRSSRGRSSGSSRGSSRDYDRNYSSRDYDRSYSSRDDYRYDRDYDRGYSSRSSRDYDRGYSSSRRSSYDDFSDWERTAPNWDDRGSSRGRSSGGSRGPSSRSSREYDRDYDRPRSGGSRNGRPSGGSGSRNGSRPSGQKKGQKKRRKSAVQQIIPIAVGLVFIILAALILKSFIGGGGSDYALSISSKTIVVDETATAAVTGLSETETYDIQWSSSDNGVISVDGNGETCTLLAKSNGSVVITATVNGETIEETVMVVDVAPGVKDIKFTEEVVEIISGQSYTVNATVIMESEDMTPAKLSWSSSDNSVARVNDSGVIEAREVGTAIIKATAGEQTAEIAVTVVPNPDGEEHDESESTGAEPEEGATPPEGTAGATQEPAAGTEENTDAPAEGEGEGEATA
ncbi:MAG: Ig-like domain-containing protein [Ruminiclostridium sp.]|nr:Ig-like domain-containing protein [Ruminiclostridium sp.]